MTHKPKLIAVTGFSDGAGTSSLACSLAASFADADDGKVIYVDLNSAGDRPVKRASAADNGTGDSDRRMMGSGSESNRRTSSSLGIGAENGQGRESVAGSARQFMPKQLFDLIPKFKASEFDYIIFDMPPLGPTSPTLAMAGFMDKVLMVVDAGKTNRDVIKRGYKELVAGNADVSTVLNKTRENLPSWLQG